MMIPIKVRFDKANDQDPKEDTEVHDTEIRRMRITQDVLSKYGYMDGCEGCETKRAGNTTVKNAEQGSCKQRMAMKVDDEPTSQMTKGSTDE